MAIQRRPRLETDVAVAAKLILDDYQGFLAAGLQLQDDAAVKAFAARHAAGKAALAHLEYLLKVVGVEEKPTTIIDSLAQWRALMPPQATEEPDSDDDGAGR